MVLEILEDRLEPESRVLDAGCGTGGMLGLLSQRGWTCSLEGIDISPVAVRHCLERGFAGVRVARVEELPFEDASFDAVLSLDVLYHGQVDERKALAEMSRALRPGGVLVVKVAAFECLRGLHDAAVCSVRRYKRSQLRFHLAIHKLEVELIHYWNTWLFVPLWIWRSWTRWRSGKSDGAGSELQLSVAWVNRMLKGPAGLDAKLCRLLRVPFGSFLLAVARKPGSAGN